MCRNSLGCELGGDGLIYCLLQTEWTSLQVELATYGIESAVRQKQAREKAQDIPEEEHTVQLQADIVCKSIGSRVSICDIP